MIRLHWAQASQGCANGKTTKTHLGDGSVYDTLLAKFVQEAFCYLKVPISVMKSARHEKGGKRRTAVAHLTHFIGTIVPGDFLTHHEHRLVP